MFSGLNTRAQVCQFHSQGSTFRKEPWGELAPKFSDLVASKSISFSEKHGKLVASEKNVVTSATTPVAMSSSHSNRCPTVAMTLSQTFVTNHSIYMKSETLCILIPIFLALRYERLGPLTPIWQPNTTTKRTGNGLHF